MNNAEVPEDTIDENYVQVNQLQSIVENEKINFFERIKQKPDKKFYFGMEFKKINNPEFNNPSLYPIKLMPVLKQFYTPQINKISFDMPDVPLLSQFRDVPRVFFFTYHSLSSYC